MSSGLRESCAVPSIITKANGGVSSSTTRVTRGSRWRARPLAVASLVRKSTSSSSRTKHTGTACGRPSARVVARIAVRVPLVRKARRALGVISSTIGISYVSHLMDGPALADDAAHQVDRDGLRGERDEAPCSAGGGIRRGVVAGLDLGHDVVGLG